MIGRQVSSLLLALVLLAAADARADTATAAELCAAVEENELTRVKLLSLQQPALMSARCGEETPLHVAARVGNKEVIEFLLEKEVAVDLRAGQGRSPLHIAAIYGQLDVVALLRGAGASAVLTDDDLRTPLHLAVLNDRDNVANNLSGLGADNLKDKHGFPSFFYDAYGSPRMTQETKAIVRAEREKQPRFLAQRDAGSSIVSKIYIGLAALLVGIVLFTLYFLRGHLALFKAPEAKKKPARYTGYRDKLAKSDMSLQVKGEAQIDLAPLRSDDPDFHIGFFIGRVKSAFEKYQVATSRQSVREVRPFISDGVHERLTLKFEEERALGYRNQVTGVVLRTVKAFKFERDAIFDTLHVNIIGEASFSRVRLTTGQTLSTAARPEVFSEVWSFLRQRSAKTKRDGPGLLEGHCPNCGAGIDENTGSMCEHCDTRLRSGERDWVLAEVSQRSEWAPPQADEVKNIEAYRARDAEISVQHIEDRASVIFWRQALADRKGSAALLARVSTPEYCEAYGQRLRAASSGVTPRAVYTQCHLGAVRTIGVQEEEGWVQTLVELRWSGRRMEVGRGGLVASEQGDQVSFLRTLFILGRKPGVRSDSDKAMSSGHCPGCGAPELGGKSGQCEYCETLLNDGSQDWVLLDDPIWADIKAQAMLKKIYWEKEEAPLPTMAAMIAWMIKTALVDGEVSAPERARLEKLCTRNHIKPEQLDDMIGAARAGTLDMPVPQAASLTAKVWLGNMVGMAIVDGVIDDAERQALLEMGEKLGFGTDYVQAAITQQVSEAQRRVALFKGGPPPA